MTVDEDEGENGEDVKEGHACWGNVEGSNVRVHCRALLDKEGGHLGEDYRVDYGTEPDGEHLQDTLYLFHLGYRAEMPRTAVEILSVRDMTCECRSLVQIPGKHK